MKHIVLSSIFLMAAGALASAQVGVPVILPAPATPNVYAQDLIKYLGLGDAQVQSLNTVAQARTQAQQAVYKQISEKQQALNALLTSGSTDALHIGQLTIDIRNLQKQAQLPAEPWRSQALGILTAEQKNRLPALAAALQLQSAAYQAINFNLVDRPTPVALPTPKLLVDSVAQNVEQNIE